MDVYREDTRFCIEAQGIYASFPDTAANRNAVLVLLRGLKRSRKGPHWFTFQELASIVESPNRQAASEHVEGFRACGEDFGKFLKRQRKVDEEVVEAVYTELCADPLIEISVLRDRVQARLDRSDLSESNMRAALDQIPYTRLRGVLKAQMKTGDGQIQYREEVLLKEMLSKLESEPVKWGLQVEVETQDRVIADPTSVRKLLEPGASMEEIPTCLQQICWCLSFYFWGVPLSRLGLWFGVNKSTILRWMLGLVNQVYAPLQDRIVQSVRLGVVYVDEKWIKIKGKWHYWFVAIDELTEIPVVCYLSPTRSQWVARWMGLWLKKFKGKLQAIATDGLKSYRHLLPEVPHLLCHFHHQQGVTAWLKQHLPAREKDPQPKAQMKKLLQTQDKRTVQRRLSRLEARAEEWGITGWVKTTREHLGQLLPAVGSRILPRTTNTIERFFGKFNRFYKVRRSFQSIQSARDQLCLFLVVYLFTQRVKDGKAPIESIWTEAAQTPFYRLLNDPFGLRAETHNVKQMPKMADSRPLELLRA